MPTPSHPVQAVALEQVLPERPATSERSKSLAGLHTPLPPVLACWEDGQPCKIGQRVVGPCGIGLLTALGHMDSRHAGKICVHYNTHYEWLFPKRCSLDPPG